MMSRSVRLSLVGIAVVLLFAASAWAQIVDVSGIVQRVDVAARTIYLTDGRAVVLKPDAHLMINGREIALGDVQPGATLVTTATPATAAPSTVVVQSGAATVGPPVATSTAPPPVPPPPMAPPAAAPPAAAMPTYAAPIDATGVVSQVDPRTGTVTLADGRVLRVTGGTTLWQPVPITSVTPGVTIHVRNAEPVAFQPGMQRNTQPTSLIPSRHAYWMGTVRSVDPATSRVSLADGTTVQVRPGSRVSFHGQSLSIADLRPGDEIVIGTPRTTRTAGPTSSTVEESALPRQVVGDGVVVDADVVRVVQRTRVR